LSKQDIGVCRTLCVAAEARGKAVPRLIGGVAAPTRVPQDSSLAI